MIGGMDGWIIIISSDNEGMYDTYRNKSIYLEYIDEDK